MVIARLDTSERVPILWKHLKELPPARHHGFLRVTSVPLAINECMVLRHQLSKTVDVLLVDTLIELQRNRLWILRVHIRKESVQT